MRTFRLRGDVRRRTAALLATGVLLTGAACSSDDGGGDEAARRSTTTAATAPTPEEAGHACDQGATTDAVEAVPMEGTPSDVTVTSFDGTEIRAHWFPIEGASPDAPAPTVLMGPGWSLAGDTSVDGDPIFGSLSIGALNEAGYNVLTWDPRGFGASTGAATVNAPDAEGRDVQVLLDWVAEQPGAQLDGDGDPRTGMVGFSYGGGIQLTVAAIDCRVDAIVPGLAWHSLETSLFKAETVKLGWSQILVDAAAAGELDPHIPSAYASGRESGVISAEDREWFVSRGPGDAIDAVEIPTLIVQGTVDTLFTLDEALTIHASLVEREVPTKMLWFCGGHGACLTDEGDPDRVSDASFAWLDRWVKGDTSVDTGPAFDLVDQDGTRWTGDAVPPEDGTVVANTDEPTRLELTAEGGSGPTTLTPDSGDILAGLVTGITPAPAENAVEVPIPLTDDVRGGLVVGAPRLTLTYVGTVPDGPRPVRLFAQIVDLDRGVVVGNQVTPVPVVLDGASRSVEVDLEVIAQRLPDVGGEGLVLQIVATTTAYAPPRLGGEVTINAVDLQLPLVSDLAEG